MPRLEDRRFGTLNCHLVDELNGSTARKLVVLCHGFGAPGTDLVGLSEYFLDDSFIASGTRFVFPEAPLNLTPLGIPGGRAWWPINMQRLAEMYETRDFSQLADQIPDSLPAASDALLETVRALQREFSAADGDLFLGGFSQGAMVTTDITLRHALQPAQLILMSGTMMCRKEWSSLAAAHPGCPVIQSHGRMDMVLPFEPSTWLRDLLSDNGFAVNFIPFDGPHTVPVEAMDALKSALISSLEE